MSPRQSGTPRPQALAVVLACGLALLPLGCRQREPIIPDTLMPAAVQTTAPLPSYRELVDRYNANLAGLDRLWSATDVQIRFRNEAGKAKFEEGEGKLLYVRPNELALTVEKLGKTYLWAGGDAERFWMFDNDSRTAYVGHHRNIGKPCMQELPLPVHPASVPYLLGLVPLDPAVPPDEGGTVERLQGYYLIEPPGLKLRLLLDPTTARPVRVDLTDANGKSVVISRLEAFAPVQIEGAPPESSPHIATRADVYVTGEEARMTLFLKRLSDGRDGNRIRPQAFDFDTLIKAHKPKEVIQLDAACEQQRAAP